LGRVSRSDRKVAAAAEDLIARTRAYEQIVGLYRPILSAISGNDTLDTFSFRSILLPPDERHGDKPSS